MARKKLPRPTVDYILDRLDELRDEYADDHDRIDAVRAMRTKTWDINVPQRLKDVADASGLEYHDATIAAEHFELPRLYLEKEPSLQLRAGKEKKETGGLTTRVEYFTTAALFGQCGASATGPSTLHRMVDGTFEGAGWTYLVKAEDVWDDYHAAEIDDYEDGKPGVDKSDGKTKYQRYDAATEEMKKKAGVPVLWKHADARNCYPDFDGDRLAAMIEVQTRSLSTCARDYDFGMNELGDIVPARTAVKDWTKNADDKATIEFIKYRDKEWMSYVVRYSGGYKGAGAYSGSAYEIPKYTKRHGYKLGHPGYYCSLGWTANYEYARVATWAVSEPKRDLVKYLSWLRSVYAYIAVFQAIPPVSVEVPPDGATLLEGDGRTPKLPEVYHGGMEYYGTPGTKRIPMVFPSTADHLQAEIVQTQRDIGRHSAAKKSGELGDLGGEGFALSTVYEKDRARYGAFEDAITAHLTQVTLDFWKLVQQLGEPVYAFRNADKDAGFVEVKPSDFDTALQPTWTLHVDSTAANIIKQRYAEAMEKAGYFSHQQAVEFMGQNFDEVVEGLAEDRVRGTDAYKAGEEAEVWAGMGRGAWMKKQDQAQQMAAVAAGAGGPVPPGTQGAGMAGPGMPGDQASLAMSPNGAGAQPGQEFRPTGMPASPSTPSLGAAAQVTGGQIG
jgi:hypothetical protein